MSCISQQRHILKRDGTNRFDRLPAAFNPSFVKIDEKPVDALLQLIQNLAGEIQYYNAENQPDGDWKVFFEDVSKTQEPHIALLLTFLRLYGEAQKHLNETGKRHLDFYYRDFLKIKQKLAVPDRVNLIIETAKDVLNHQLKAGTEFTAGKDDSGKILVYKSVREIILNKASIGSLKSVFIDKQHQNEVWAASVANSADGKGKTFRETEPTWPAFGGSQSGLAESNKNMEKASVGFAIASPAFFLKEGERIVRLTIKLAEMPAGSGLSLSTLLNRDLSNSLLASATAEKSWTDPVIPALQYNTAEKELIISFTFGPEHPAITAFNSKIHKAGFTTSQPVIKLMANNTLTKHPYQWLRSLRFEHITATITVNGAKDLVLQNEQGSLDNQKPFQPFGTYPVKGSKFYIGSAEIFSKKLNSLKLNYQWKDLPDVGFSSYYQSYHTDFSTKNFTFNLAALAQANWKPIETGKNFQLFDQIAVKKSGKKGSKKVLYKLNSGKTSLDVTLNDIDFEQVNSLIPVSSYNHASKTGFIKMEMTGRDFGQKEFPAALTRQSVMVSKTLLDDPKATPPPLPNPPYIPVMEYVSLDYSCTTEISIEQKNSSTGNRFFHIEPFGEPVITDPTEAPYLALLPQFEAQGNFYIGIKDLKPPQNLSVLFQIAEDSADPETIDDSIKIKWSFLTTAGWIDFEANQIISDTTNGFLKTGIIIFEIPGEATNLNKAFSGEIHWLRASYDGETSGLNRLIAVYTQAVEVVFSDQGNDPVHYSESLPDGSIGKLLVQDAAIKKINQPFASFGGQMPELGADYPVPFYTRVSERLRHKNRGVTIWDIERLVLERFPNIYKVKALNHSSDKTDIAPGNITIVVIEKIRNKNAVNPLQPRTSRNTLIEIKDFIGNFVSPFAGVFVQNPLYEEILATFKVAFKPGFDPGFYLKKLNTDIKQFLSPWAYLEGKDIVFGNIIYKSSILYFIEKLDYVDFVIDFKMSHLKPNWGIGCMEILDDFYVGAGETLIDVDKAEPKTSRSILVSAPDHSIGLVDKTGISCD